MSLFTTSDTLYFQFQLVLGEEVNTELSINFYFNRLTGGDGVGVGDGGGHALGVVKGAFTLVKSCSKTERIGDSDSNRIAHIWHQCRKTAVVSCHRCIMLDI